MLPGKVASQAGHAYLSTWLTALEEQPEVARGYASRLNTKVCLQASLSDLCRAKMEAEQAGLPTFLVVDSGNENFFEGRPVITALGFGPVIHGRIPSFLLKLKLY